MVTSDNGMAFPRAKANVYEYGIHVPLAIRWGVQVPGGRMVHDLVSLVDVTPTLLEAAGLTPPASMTGRSFLPALTSNASGWVDPARTAVYAARERHSSSRWRNLGYPQRALRTPQYLYVRNLTPERWPAGAPRKFEEGRLGPLHGGYHDIDAAPTLDFMIDQAATPGLSRFLYLATAHRPAEEVYDILQDPACLRNLALEPAYDPVTEQLRARLKAYLEATGDPRVAPGGEVFETYERLRGSIRSFPPPEWALPEDAGASN